MGNQTKVCRKCRKPQQNELHILCETCREPFVSFDDGLRLLTKDEITELSSAILKDWRIRFIRWILPFAALGGVFLAALFLNWQAGKRLRAATEVIEQSASNEVSRAYSTATNQLARQFQTFAADASNQIGYAYSSVTNQIAEEFQTPRIKQTVETVAKGEAKSILEAEVQPAVKSFKEEALFSRTIARAQGYDFKAYQALLEIGKGTNDNARLASQVLAEIDRSLARDRSDFSPRRTFMTVTGTNVYSGPFTSDELALLFSNIAHDQTSFNREGFVNTVAGLKQPLFMPSLIELLTNETDLGVADRLTIAISEIAKDDFHPRDFERITAWWKDNHSSFTNWPVAIFERGMQEFKSVHYPQATGAFEQVLKLDSGADMSRAYAIACCWETGQTNRATSLGKEFKNPSARWAQWASAKADLESGNVSNATVRFYSITTNFPSMDQLPDRNSHIYRKIDWELFDKLKEAKAP